MNDKDRECYIRSLEGFARILDPYYQPSHDVNCAPENVEAAEGVFRVILGSVAHDVNCAPENVEAAEGVFRVILGSVAHDLEATRRENVYLRKTLEQK